MATSNFTITMIQNKDDLDIELEDIEVNKFERAINKTRFLPFSKYCYWLLIKYSENERIFYTNDLCKFAKMGYNTAYRFFEDLVNLGYVSKSMTGNVVHYSLVTNSENPKLKELLPYIKKRLLRAKDDKNGNE